CNYDTNSGPSILITSRDDDLFGDSLGDNSTHVPSYAPSQAIWFYGGGASIGGMRIRWAQTAVEFDGDGYLSDSALELCGTGVYAMGTPNIQNSTVCGVTSPGS